MTNWQPIDTAPKDGSWIIGYTGHDGCTGHDDLYVVMRWWDGYLPDESDDLSCDEEGTWTGSAELHHLIEYVTHWMAFTPHPTAPPKTTSYGAFDAANGCECVSRAARGIPENVIAANQEFHRRALTGGDLNALWTEIAKEHGLGNEVSGSGE